MDKFQVVIWIISGIVLMSILLMHDIHRRAQCSKCNHCKATAREERQENAHRNFHYWNKIPYFQCKDEDCPGRK